jgi:hypothetical protein
MERHRFERCAAQLDHDPLSELLHEVLPQRLEVLRAIAERIERNHRLGQAGTEIATKPALRDRGAEIAVGGCHDPNVDRRLCDRANRANRPRIEHPQQLGLDLGGELADLVEEQRPVLRRPEQPRLRRRELRDGALDRAETKHGLSHAEQIAAREDLAGNPFAVQVHAIATPEVSDPVDALLVRPDDLGVPTGRAMIIDLDVSFRIHLASQLDSIGAEDHPAPITADAAEQQHERMTRRLRGPLTAILGRFTGIPTALVPTHAHQEQRAYQVREGIHADSARRQPSLSDLSQVQALTRA